MTPIALSYLVAGLSALLWPLLLLLFKRRVLGAQWMLMVALSMTGLSIVLYSCMFNSFLHDEYLLVILFMVLSLVTPPMVHVAIASLTRMGGVSRRVRLVFLPAILTTSLLFLSVFVGGPDMYKLWIQRGGSGMAGLFFPASWRYNLIVAIHYYLFFFTLMAEVLFEVCFYIRSTRRMGRQLAEYCLPNVAFIRDARHLCCFLAILGFIILINLALFPFNAERPLWVALVSSAVESVLLLIIGWMIFRLKFGTERIRQQSRSAMRSHSNLSQLGRMITRHVEDDKAFLDPDLSVFSLAQYFHVSQDEVVDAIHQIHGSPFAGYVNSQRIEHATALILNVGVPDADDPDSIERLAHQCGYLSAEAFLEAFQRVMQVSFKQWCADNV